MDGKIGTSHPFFQLGLQGSRYLLTGPSLEPHLGPYSYRVSRVSHVPVLDREEGQSFRPQTLTIVYAAPLIRVQEQVWAAGVFIALASLVLLGATFLLALYGIRRGLLPLQRLAEQAALVSAQNWELRLPTNAEETAELRPLTQSMITMLARLERSFVQQREFMGNAAHELKTPVAVLKSTLQSLLHRPFHELCARTTTW